MRTRLRVAVVGCGTAGLAAAAHLARDGHDVLLFERFDTPLPVGAGLLLQPLGLACLACLDLEQKVIDCGARIDHLDGRTTSGRRVFDVHYQDLGPQYFGLGIHRGALFRTLLDEVLRLDVPIRSGCNIVDTLGEDDCRILKSSDGDTFGPFDLVVDASGVRSDLRQHGRTKFSRPYPYSALWGVVDDPGQAFGGNCLQQRYQGAQIMIGLLPVGKDPRDGTDKCAFFWSLRSHDYQSWRDTGLPVWKEQVRHCWPEIEPMLSQFEHADNLTFATYSDTVMQSWHEDRLVFIGDAAHSTSPQLGQGANLALADALVLSAELIRHESVNEALAAYSITRKRHLRFYQTASRWLTPFFQSDSKAAGWIRDISFGWLGKAPYLRMEMLRTLAGIKDGLFSRIDLGRWHSRYGARSHDEERKIPSDHIMFGDSSR